MASSFQFARLPLIFFGNGKLSLLPELIKRYGKTILLVTGKRSFTGTEHYQMLSKTFQENGINQELVVVSGEPSPEVVDEAVMRFRDEKIDVVAGIGGGSVLDAGKAISAMMYKPGTVKDYLEDIGNKEHPGTKIPYIAVPTTAGTGSEATKNAVISSIGKNGFKKSLRHDNFVPDIAVVDPELTLNCPPGITAASGMDCFTQLTEAFLSVKSSSYTDALALEGLKAVRTSLVKCVKNGSDPEARSDMSFAALTSGICLANAGLGAVHGFASSIGGTFNVPHGTICGTLMAPANEINIRELRRSGTNASALKKYALLGHLFCKEDKKSDEYSTDSFISYLKELTEEIHLPLLRHYGIKKEYAGLICAETSIKNNPVGLSIENLMEILLKRL
jgi:alcohol dehydrogenase class IV